MEPPKIKFVTKVWHPNIDPSEGEICLDLLEKANWSPAMSIQQVGELVSRDEYTTGRKSGKARLSVVIRMQQVEFVEGV